MDDTYCAVYDFTGIRSSILESKGEWSLEDQVRVDMLELGLNPHLVEDVNIYWTDVLKNYGG
jgi:predicted nuclease of restriction endonuclease-like (RecB) superfamily